MGSTMEIAGLYLYAYLVGSVPTAYLLGRLAKGIDIRSYGSGNVGGTNLAHQAGRLWLLPLGCFDILVKGASPVLIAQYALGWESDSLVLLGAPILSIIGHNWSVFIRFQGGRGIAVVCGILLAISPLLIGAFLVLFSAGWLATRSAGVWVLVSLLALPLWGILMGQPAAVTWLCVVMLGLVLLKRLLSNGTPMPQDISRRRVLFNRAFRDRDVDDRSTWVDRLPSTSEVTS